MNESSTSMWPREAILLTTRGLPASKKRSYPSPTRRHVGTLVRQKLLAESVCACALLPTLEARTGMCCAFVFALVSITRLQKETNAQTNTDTLKRKNAGN